MFDRIFCFRAMGYHFFLLASPFLPGPNVSIINRAWMPAKQFAKAIGTTEESLNKRFSHLFVARVPGCWKWRNLVNVAEHGRIILRRFWSNEKDVEDAVKQLEKHCLPRPDDVEEKDDEEEKDAKDKEEADDEEGVVPKKRVREVEEKNGEEHQTHEDAVVKLLRVHTKHIEGMVKDAMDLVKTKAIKAMTALPEFRSRVSKVADDLVAEEVLAKREAANVAFEAWKEKRRAQLKAEMRAELRAELEPEIRQEREQALSVLTLAYNPALGEAVTNRVSERGVQGIDLDVFFDSRKK